MFFIHPNWNPCPELYALSHQSSCSCLGAPGNDADAGTESLQRRMRFGLKLSLTGRE